MSAIWLPLTATAAAGTVTYYSCVRPMRRDRSCHTTTSGGTIGSGADLAAPGRAEEIRALREEVQLLRHEVEMRDTEHDGDRL